MSLPSEPVIAVWPTCGETAIQFFWEAPATGAPFEKYTIASSAISYSQDVSANVNDFTVTGLTAGTEYDFTITATNATGTGPAAAFPRVAVGALPFGPSQASVSTVNETTALVTWAPSTIANEAPTRWYIITGEPSTAGASTLIKTEYAYRTSTFFKGLSTNVSYRFLVQGVASPGYCLPFAYTSTVQILPDAFLPTMVTGMQLWLDASVASNYTVSGSNLTRWFDRSGNARDGTTFSGTVALQSNSINGSNSIFFNFAAIEGSNTFSNVPSSIVPTAFVVMKTPNSGQAFTRYFNLFKAGYAYESQLLYRFEGSNIATSMSGNDFRAQTQFPNYTDPFIVTGQHLGVYNNISMNGNLMVTDYLRTPRSSNYGYTNWAMGRRGTTNAEMNGNVGEVIMYHGILNNIDRMRIEGYLAWKWGLQNSLAATHPFKTVAPSPPRSQSVVTSDRIIHFEASSWDGTGVWPNQGALGSAYDAALVTGSRAKNAAGNGVVFDTNSYYLLSTIGLQTQYTLSAWVKLTSSNNFNNGFVFTEKDIDAAPGFRAINMAIQTSSNNINGFLWKTNGQPSVTTSNVLGQSNIWVHYAYTVSTFNTTSTMSYTYSNGALMGSTLGVFTPTTNSKEYYIGANDEVWSGQPKFLGEIGEISVYNTPLTYAQIRQNYEARWPTYYP